MIKKMQVILMPNLKAFRARIAKHVIYAHQNDLGEVYIGQSDCIVNRWTDHQLVAKSHLHPDYDQKFKKSIRSSISWTHYIVAIAEDQESANDIESAAIEFYKPVLNSNSGPSSNIENRYGFQLLSSDGREIEIEAKVISRYRKQERYTDKERKTIRCRAISKARKSHVSFECLSDGKRVSISREKRAGYKVGDIVTISLTAPGKTAYTTTDCSVVTKVTKL